jgi:3-hydroxymyristoyl/3-hydroxydecanoyl-(acyl carrier protein) dehydratase
MDQFEDPSTKVVLFLSIDGAKFRRQVVPGDQLRFELQLVQLSKNNCRMLGEAYVDGVLACEADMLARVIDRADQ